MCSVDTLSTFMAFKDVTANVCDTTHDRMGILITGMPGHRIENISFENVSIAFPGGGPLEAVGREVPEDIARYPEQFFSASCLRGLCTCGMLTVYAS